MRLHSVNLYVFFVPCTSQNVISTSSPSMSAFNFVPKLCVMARLNSINANKDTFKMYTDMFLTEYIILAIHLNSQGALSDVVLNKVKKNANLMI